MDNLRREDVSLYSSAFSRSRVEPIFVLTESRLQVTNFVDNFLAEPLNLGIIFLFFVESIWCLSIRYQVRWTIEAAFKEYKQYLNLGACQSNDFDAQIANTTITMIQYILLMLKKQFDDYETRGEVFRDVGEQMCERGLHLRLWDLLALIMKFIIETFNIDIDLAIFKLSIKINLTEYSNAYP